MGRRTIPTLGAPRPHEWALQGSNSPQGCGASGAPQEAELQEAVYRAARMLLSGLAPGQVAMLLRSLAAILEAEASGSAAGGGVGSQSGPSSMAG